MRRKKNPQIRRSDILTNQMLDETLVYDLENDRAFCLNETSGRIWNLCDGTRSPAQIAEQLGTKADTEVPEVVVLEGIAQLAKDGLLEDNGYRAPSVGGFSRRDLIQRAAVALPVVSALAVPRAAHAQSCIDLMLPCIIDGQPPCCPDLFCFPENSDLPGAPGFCEPIPGD